MHGSWRRFLPRLAVVAGIGLLGILVTAASASGQAAVEQYIPSADPTGNSGPSAGGGGGALDFSAATGQQPVAAETDSGTARGGSLPLTDYPSTPFVWAVILLVGAGLIARIVTPVLHRRGLLKG